MSNSLIALGHEDAPPLLKIRLPLPHRLNCFIRLWLLKALVWVVFAVNGLLHPPLSRPTLVKSYPCRPGLQTRVFFPPNYKAGDILDLYLNIHGGGFVIGDPSHDDDFCAMWAKRTGMLIVSLDYSKAPLYPYPVAVYDIAALVNAVLGDSSLPIDMNKTEVVIGGFSAGGNLALCASQLPGLKGQIKAVLAFYPIVDWGHPPDEKLAMRPYKEGPKDALEFSSYWFDWGYVSSGQNRRDPLLSPCYAKKEDLPPWIYIIGAQWDMLRLESQEMIHKLAATGKEEMDQEQDFETGTYKWTLARGCSHGFTHNFGHKADKKLKREQKCDPIYMEAHQWLQKALAKDD
ncbi:Arylesterase, partial [Lachnellula occidentalis]